MRKRTRSLLAEQQEHHAAMLARLRDLLRWDRRGLSLEVPDLTYWGTRFHKRAVRFWTGCTFDKYLFAPDYWEKCAEEAKAAAAKGVHRLPLVSGRYLAGLFVTLN